LAKTDPKKAADMLAKMDSPDKGAAYHAVAAQYGAANFDEAQAWIRTLPAGEQAAALAAAIGGLSDRDPAAAARQVALMEAGDAKDRLIPDVVGDLARMDPQTAADFLKQQDSERAQRDAMGRLMPTWVAQNSEAALSYANSLPEGNVRDSALQSYVWSNNTGDPQATVQVAETISDERDRNRSIGITVSRWMREDPEAARAYVQQSTTLSDQAKERILEGRGWGWGGRGRR
jgi:hypothetical protein